jgi:hypothetical protein
MSAKVTFFGCMVLGVDEDGVIRTCGDAGFATDANAFVEIDNAVFPGVHRSCRARLGAWWVFTLIATSDLESAARMGENADVNILDVGAID